MSANRNSYMNEFKKQTVEEAKAENLAQFCRQNKLELRMVRRWIQKNDQIAYGCESGNAKKRSTGSGRQTVNVQRTHGPNRLIPNRFLENISNSFREESAVSKS